MWKVLLALVLGLIPQAASASAQCEIGAANAVAARNAAVLLCAGFEKSNALDGRIQVSGNLTQNSWLVWIRVKEEGSVRQHLASVDSLTTLAVSMDQIETAFRLKTTATLCLQDAGNPEEMSAQKQTALCVIRKGFSDGYRGIRWNRGAFEPLN